LVVRADVVVFGEFLAGGGFELQARAFVLGFQIVERGRCEGAKRQGHLALSGESPVNSLSL